MTLLGAFNDLFALQIFLATMVSSVAVLVLGVACRRIRRRPRRLTSAADRQHPHLVVLEPPRPIGPARNTARSPTTGRRPASNPLSSSPSAPQRQQLVAEAKEHRSGRVRADRCTSGGYPAEDVVARR